MKISEDKVKEENESLKAALEAAEHQRGALAQAIADAVTKAGMWNGEVGLTGPHLIMFCDDMASVIASQPDSERDAARMDWLVQKIVDVRAELRYGSRFMFTSQAKYDDEEFVGTTLREQIDAAQQGEAQPLPGDKP